MQREKLEGIVHSDPAIMGGAVVFVGTRAFWSAVTSLRGTALSCGDKRVFEPSAARMNRKGCRERGALYPRFVLRRECGASRSRAPRSIRLPSALLHVLLHAHLFRRLPAA